MVGVGSTNAELAMNNE